jgi:uncharacterized protein YqiB (DUF1249 family)
MQVPTLIKQPKVGVRLYKDLTFVQAMKIARSRRQKKYSYKDFAIEIDSR